MRIFLHPDLQLQGRVLTDTKLGVHYSVTSDTAWLLAQIMHSSHVDTIIATTSKEKHVTRQEASRSLYALLGFLDSFGGARIMWPVRFNTVRARIPWRHRYGADLRGFWSAILQAYGSLAIVTTCAFLGMYVAVPDVPALVLLLPTVLLASCVIHEAGHLIAVRAYGMAHILLARVGYAAVVYVRPNALHVRIIAASGSIFAALLYMAAAVVAPPGFLRPALFATALLHMCSLLPFFADGKTIWRTHE